LFDKQRKAAPVEIKQALYDALDLFSENPTHPSLRNHPLTGKYAGFRSINVTDDWRAVYREREDSIKFVALGSHQKLYG
jgi:addiction module RelE/StbE family toxin